MQPGGQVLAAQSFADRGKDEMVQGLTIAETHFRLGRMHVDIHQIRWQFQEQKHDRIATRHEQAAIRFLDGVGQAAITDPPAVEEQVLHPSRASLAGRVGNVASQLR